MDEHHIATSANGKNVYINLIQPPISVVVGRNPHLLTLIKEVVSHSKFTGSDVELEYDMKRTVGYTDFIETKEEDAVFYARQLKADAYTRFVKNRKTNATSIVSIRLKQVDPISYNIKNVWLGGIPVPLPGEQNATSQSQDYWLKHAVVYNGQPLMASSITKDCPY
jgi:hypothetical protein